MYVVVRNLAVARVPAHLMGVVLCKLNHKFCNGGWQHSCCRPVSKGGTKFLRDVTHKRRIRSNLIGAAEPVLPHEKVLILAGVPGAPQQLLNEHPGSLFFARGMTCLSHNGEAAGYRLSTQSVRSRSGTPGHEQADSNAGAAYSQIPRNGIDRFVRARTTIRDSGRCYQPDVDVARAFPPRLLFPSNASPGLLPLSFTVFAQTQIP